MKHFQTVGDERFMCCDLR